MPVASQWMRVISSASELRTDRGATFLASSPLAVAWLAAGRRRVGGHREPVMAFGLPPAAHIVPASHLSTICWEGLGFRERFGGYKPPKPPRAPPPTHTLH